MFLLEMLAYGVETMEYMRNDFLNGLDGLNLGVYL